MLSLEQLIAKREGIIEFAKKLGFEDLAIVIPSDPYLLPYRFMANYNGAEENYGYHFMLLKKYLESSFDHIGIEMLCRKSLMHTLLSPEVNSDVVQSIKEFIFSRELYLDNLDVGMPFTKYFADVAAADDAPHDNNDGHNSSCLCVGEQEFNIDV